MTGSFLFIQSRTLSRHSFESKTLPFSLNVPPAAAEVRRLAEEESEEPVALMAAEVGAEEVALPPEERVALAERGV